MPDKPVLTPEIHKQQIEAYTKILPQYEKYAIAFRRILERACRASFPEAVVQSRAKTVSSFAEKAARKYHKYQDPVNQLNDLCGGRVIVQTAEQVRSVRNFIEANFDILESEDKGLLLSTDKFGYRDMHYIVKVKSSRAEAIGFTPAEIKGIGDKRAEIQVRTWLQHAWADTLHDRIYKNALKLSDDTLRAGNLLAALMEEGDRNFNVLAGKVDELIANYTALAPKDEVIGEIGLQHLILGNEKEPEQRTALALRLARLVAASGDHRRVVDLLEPHKGVRDASRAELLLELGYNICCLERERPASARYLEGIEHIKAAIHLCEEPELIFATHLRKKVSLHARALARLAWALTVVPGEESEVRRRFRQAHDLEPSNPYYLSAMLGFELHFQDRSVVPAIMTTTVREAIRVCREHATVGIELPYAYFSAGRLSLLLDQGYDALDYYSRGLRYCLSGTYCVPSDALAEEQRWIRGTYPGAKALPPSQRVINLLDLARTVAEGETRRDKATTVWRKPVLILSGGAASLAPDMRRKIRDLLEKSCGDFCGTIVSGGTSVGVPGCIGDVAARLAAKGRKQFRLVAYQPTRLPYTEKVHPAYDERVPIGDDFLPDQILANWADLQAAGVKPAEVLLLGFGGGPLSAVEYRIALGLGASVGIVGGTGGAAESLLADPLWSALPNLFLLPFDSATIRAFAMPGNDDLDSMTKEEMAKLFHAKYVAGSSSRLPPNMRPWDKLGPTYRRANLEQARYSVEILKAAGFDVRKVKRTKIVLPGFTKAEVERMSELEHGRWNVDRLHDGWRYGKERDDSKKIHNSLVSWAELPDDIQQYDRGAVEAFPEILAKVGLEVRRKP